MAARATAEQVKELIQTSLSDETIASNMVITANTYVNANLLAEGHSAATLKQIELYLATHFVAITEERGGLIRSEYGDAEEWLSDIYGSGLKSTRYGQTALLLDTSGVLARISSGSDKLKASFVVV